MSDAALAIRRATEDDLRFVRASWFESYRFGGFAPQVQFPIYREGQNSVIERCLKTSAVFVAYAAAVPDEVCSWACGEGKLIHFVYTKLVYRRIGIAEKLVHHLIRETGPKRFHTHDTKAGRGFASCAGTVYDPYPLFPPAVPRSTR